MKEIDAKGVVMILSQNFEFKIIKTSLGEGILMNPIQAFIYSTVTGAGYLDNYLYPFTPKGLIKVFYNALDYKFVTGIFDNSTLKNTPYLLSLGKPFLFNSNKIIIPVEFNSEIELQEKLKKFMKINSDSTKYIIQRIEKSKNGNGMEPFMEYLSCEIMKKNKYIVENQIPLNYGIGSPDFGGYKLKEISEINSIHLIELSCLRIGQYHKFIKTKTNDDIIVGEAKTSTKIMKKQLLKYLDTNFFNKGYEIHPFKNSSEENLGLISIDSNYLITIKEPLMTKNYFREEKQKEYINWLQNYLKYYLIANLTNDEFILFYERRQKKKISKINDIINFVNSLSFEEIFDELERIF